MIESTQEDMEEMRRRDEEHTRMVCLSEACRLHTGSYSCEVVLSTAAGFLHFVKTGTTPNE